ncbi:helicase [Microbacterium saccharophilum]|uniref:Helicase n=1 Tax=Microbacterium saccharophilum TaxID=1213358 RepID=A0A5C8I106_9MICO|nr:helicase [Microbacterium saccharophilum]TXK11530.1 helicase [Microbacterium saccharophilum]GEP49085.1 hypothetical protein MSA03_25930 [Microbacterium saccharophilum]
MSGLSLAVGALAVTATLAVGYTGVGVAASRSIRAAAAADASALAAADAASGAAVGVPCDRAAEIAARHGASVAVCAVDGLIATVEVTVPVGVFTARGRARAGPPP